MSALRWEVLFPGAAVASMITLSGCAGGASTTAGKHDALSWRMRRPSEYSGVSVSGDCGGNNRRFSTCASRAKFLRGQAFVDKKNFDRQGQEWNVHSIKGIPEGVAALLECLHGSVDGPLQSIDPRISRNPGCGFAWRKKKEFSSPFRIEEIELPTTYTLARHLLAPFRRQSWRPA